ncbi:MAG: hypothetical protein SAK29_14705 [Scytonema sp. PMC 1069.18]|nr:hypothetical protein [Scytonema sp. PMC 1069.18]MEC4881992.1 hypothetical protein [Scytonema sp. PMC 1070.18]
MLCAFASNLRERLRPYARAKIHPMNQGRLETRYLGDSGFLAFHEYFAREQTTDERFS